MKKKIISILAALVICLSPIMFLAGCTVSEDQGVDVTGFDKTWTVVVGGSFASMTPPSDFQITYLTMEEKESPVDSNNDGKIDDSEKYETKIITTLADAIANGLRVIEGFDSSTAGNGKKMKVIFGGEYFEITYNVTDAGTTTEGNQNNQNQNNQGGTGTT